MLATLARSTRAYQGVARVMLAFSSHTLNVFRVQGLN